MPKIKLTFEKCLSQSFGFKPGQPEATTIQQVRDQFDNPRFSERTLLSLVRLINPEYVITNRDRAEQAERRELTNQTLMRLYGFLHKKLSVMSSCRLNRGMEMLLDFSGTPEADAHNEKIIKAFNTDIKERYTGGSVTERTKLMEEFIDRMERTFDESKLYSMSDRELSEKFLDLYPMYVMALEGGDQILSKNNGPGGHYQLSDSYAKKLTEFRDRYQVQMSALAARFNCIISPNYEILHSDRINPDNEHLPAIVFSDTTKPIVRRMEGEGVKMDESLSLYSTTLTVLNNNRGDAWVSKMQHHLRTHGVDPKNAVVYDSDGTTRDYTALFGLNGAGLLRVHDKLNGREFLLQSNGLELLNVDPLDAPAIVEKNTKDLVKAMDDADPWRIRAFTGSQAYADMKAAMKAVAQMRETLPDNPNPNQRVPFNKQLAALEKACKAYLKTKDPLTDTTKESERLRINAANDAIRYARETKVLMSAQEKLLKERGTDGIESGMDKEQMQSGSDNVLENLNRKMYAFYMKHMDEVGPVGQLATDIMTGLSDITELPKNPAGQLAKMVAFDLIMRERVSNDGNPGGSIESAYKKQPDLFCKKLEETASLKNLAGNMDVEGFQKFLDSAISNNIFNLTSQALKDMEPQNEPLSKQDVPVLPEQNTMVMG